MTGAENKSYELTHWDRRFLQLARFIAQWSKDPSTKVGCIIVDDMKRIVSTGFNGLPSGVEDTLERLSDRAVKYKMVVHAERNAIIDAKRNLAGMTAYVWPIMPCSECAAMIIQAGIARVIAPETDDQRLIESCRFDLTGQMFEEAGIRLALVDPGSIGDPQLP
ncbi:MAG: dCMP deaminase family protein [Rhodospirillales bacterium]